MYQVFNNISTNSIITDVNGRSLSLPSSRACYIYDQVGWKCNEITCNAHGIWARDDCCLPAEWVCDGNYQCLYDNSDEDEGCKVF